jgi:hypothetical protein
MAPAGSASRGHSQGVPGLAAAGFRPAVVGNIDAQGEAHRDSGGPRGFWSLHVGPLLRNGLSGQPVTE